MTNLFFVLLILVVGVISIVGCVFVQVAMQMALGMMIG